MSQPVMSALYGTMRSSLTPVVIAEPPPSMTIGQMLVSPITRVVVSVDASSSAPALENAQVCVDPPSEYPRMSRPFSNASSPYVALVVLTDSLVVVPSALRMSSADPSTWNSSSPVSVSPVSSTKLAFSADVTPAPGGPGIPISTTVTFELAM